VQETHKLSWLFSINGSGQPYTTLICDAYDNYNYVGESWQATAAPLLQAIGLFGSGASLDYKAAGLIFKSILGVPPAREPDNGPSGACSRRMRPTTLCS